ncbi:MAG: 3-phosphoglycerate dehydrogenase, partial [Spirochaetia bacterium]|nr:3-phosphoglycerate dehydrogenase [Spirochaetia bacterium]
SHKNIPDTISKFTTILGEAKLNISSFINQARGDVAYNIIDVDGKVTDDILAKLAACDTVNRVRPIYN